MEYKFTAEIKLNEPNINGRLYTKDSFKNCSYDVPIILEPPLWDIPMGECHIDVQDNKLLLTGNVVITDLLKETKCTPTICAISENIESDVNNNIIVKDARIKEVFFTENNAFRSCEVIWDK